MAWQPWKKGRQEFGEMVLNHLIMAVFFFGIHFVINWIFQKGKKAKD